MGLIHYLQKCKVVIVVDIFNQFQTRTPRLHCILLANASVFGSYLLIESLVSIVLCPLPVDKVKTSGLELSVDERSREASENLLSLRVTCWLSVLGNVLLVCLCGL